MDLLPGGFGGRHDETGTSSSSSSSGRGGGGSAHGKEEGPVLCVCMCMHTCAGGRERGKGRGVRDDASRAEKHWTRHTLYLQHTFPPTRSNSASAGVVIQGGVGPVPRLNGAARHIHKYTHHMRSSRAKSTYPGTLVEAGTRPRKASTTPKAHRSVAVVAAVFMVVAS